MPERKIDAPNEVEFAKEIVKHIPGAAETKRNMYLVGGASILGKVYRDVTDRRK